MGKEAAGQRLDGGKAGEEALTDPAIHDIGLNDGALPTKVLRHGGTAHLQVLHLQASPECSHIVRGPATHPPAPPAPASQPMVGQVKTRRQKAPSPPASISPAASLPGAERAQPLPHRTTRLAVEAGPEGCWIRTAGKRRGEASPGSALSPVPERIMGNGGIGRGGGGGSGAPMGTLDLPWSKGGYRNHHIISLLRG